MILSLYKPTIWFFKFRCNSARLSQRAAWIDRSGRRQNDFACECSKDSTCHNSADTNKCNCDATPPVHNWLQDTVRITRNDMLPITGFDYGLLRGKANFTVGNLVCKGLCNKRNIQNNRHGRYYHRNSIYDYDTVCDLTWNISLAIANLHLYFLAT